MGAVLNYIKKDWEEYPLRLALEIVAWMMSIACSTWMMLTVPTPPLILIYPFFITQCVIFGWSSWSRGSTGLVMNYALLITIDCVALAKMLLQ